jgi:hypothetical protein
MAGPEGSGLSSVAPELDDEFEDELDDEVDEVELLDELVFSSAEQPRNNKAATNDVSILGVV